MASKKAEHLIEIRVDRVAQLFQTLDPHPFREKDLDQEAEEYIVSWARELPDKRPIRIAIHVPAGEAQAGTSQELNEAFRRYFAGRAVAAQHDLNELFRVGRRSLAIGIPILVACFVAARLVAAFVMENEVQRLIEESLLSSARLRTGGRWRSFYTTGGRWRVDAIGTGVWRRPRSSSGRMRARRSSHRGQ